MPQGIQKPANSVLAAGNPMIVEFEVGANATAAKMLAGRVVIHDTTDGDVKEAGDEAKNPRGILLEQPDELEATAYAVGDMARVIVDGPAIVKVTFISGGGSAAPGDWLVPAADGKVKLEAVGAMGSQGARLGQIWETCTGAADTEVLMVLRITPDMKAAS